MTFLTLLLKDIIFYKIKTEHVTLAYSIPVTKNYQEHIYFVFKLGEPALLGSKMIAYEYACIWWYPWHMKYGINGFREKHHRSIVILKIVNDPLRVWKQNQSNLLFWCYFQINKDHNHILLVDNGKNDDVNGKFTEDIWYNIFHGGGTAPTHKR